MSSSDADLLRLTKVKEELDILISWGENTRRASITGFCTGSVITWLVTGRLRSIHRVGLATCVGISCGLWRRSNSMLSNMEQGLSMNGSQLQRIIAGSLLRSGPNDFLFKHLSKHFTCENVYDEFSSDKPRQRWHLRSFYGENFDNFHKVEAEDGSRKDAMTHSQSNPMKKGDSFASRRKMPKKPSLENEMRTSSLATSDPFDSIFGPQDKVGEEPTPSPPQKHERSYRRSRRRHHKETSKA